jgi:hypothetical protein
VEKAAIAGLTSKLNGEVPVVFPEWTVSPS